MTQFVESFATQQLLPPWKARDARTWAFVIRLTEARVQAYLEKYFNGAYPDRAPFAYAPLPGPQFGLLSVCHFPNVESVDRKHGSHPVSGGNPWDRITHTEVYLAVPALRHSVTADGLMTDPTMVWVQPVVYSDNDTVVFSSREIWGTDMFLATIDRHADLPQDQLHIDAGMIGIKKFNPRSVDELLACLHIRAQAQSDLALPDILKAVPDLQPFVNILGGSGMFAGDRPPPGVQESGYPNGVELNNLKQFRDCHDMGAAIYRAIVASRSSYTRIKQLVFYDASKVEIAFMWSDTLAEILETVLDAKGPTKRGPPAEHAGKAPHRGSCDGMDWDMDRVAVKAELGFAFTADIEFHVLATIHTYGVSA